MMQELALAVEELLRKAEDADSTPLSDGRSEKRNWPQNTR